MLRGGRLSTSRPYGPAIRFYVRKVRSKTPGSAEIENGYHCDRFCAAGLTLSLERQDGKWALSVKSELDQLISRPGHLLIAHGASSRKSPAG